MSLSALLDQSATILTRDDSTNDYTVVAKRGLLCRLRATGVRTSGMDPAMDQPVMRLYWAEGYTLPHDCRVVVGGVTYQFMHGSDDAPTVRGRVAYRSADLIQAEQ